MFRMTSDAASSVPPQPTPRPLLPASGSVRPAGNAGSLPDPLVRALRRRLGSSAERWLNDQFPAIVSRCLNEWGLVWEGPLPGGSTAAVIGVRDRASRPAVLKVHPEPQQAAYELLGYQRWQGHA
ncbi:MAG: hypothetical protein ACRDPW_00255, partial [Mycobacteriales bacterium]